MLRKVERGVLLVPWDDSEGVAIGCGTRWLLSGIRRRGRASRQAAMYDTAYLRCFAGMNLGEVRQNERHGLLYSLSLLLAGGRLNQG